MSRKIAILDTTLRDGEQAPGASMNADEKVVVARQLIRLGVDVIEAGFPHSSPGDFRAVQEIGLLAGKSCTVCAFARAKEIDIKKAAEALSTAQHSRIHLGIGVSAIHIKDKLHMTEDEVLTAIKDSVTLAASLVDEVEFYADNTEYDVDVDARTGRITDFSTEFHGRGNQTVISSYHARYDALDDIFDFNDDDVFDWD